MGNAVRCVGNMLYYLDLGRLPGGEEEFGSLMSAGTKCMITSIQTGKIMKIRWNACYAASNILKKEGLGKDYSWKRQLLDCLLDTVVNFQNFKVRINAAVALGSVVSQATLGPDYFLRVLEGLLSSLENTHSVEVFGEWQHQENLVNQLSSSICSIIALSQSASEFSKVASLMSDNWELISSSLMASIKRISPEKSSPFLSASQAAERLSQGGREEVQQLLELLRDCSNSCV